MTTPNEVSSMTPRRLCALAALVLVTGCNELPTDASSVPVLSLDVPQSVHVERPHHGKCDTTFRNAAPGAPFTIDVTCTLTHLGLTSGSAQQMVIPTGPPLPNGTLPVAISNSATYFAASGEELRATFAGSGIIDLVQASVAFSGTETYDGGTGRFTAASGSAHIVGTASLISNTGAFRVSGVLGY